MNIIFMRHGEAGDNVKEIISDKEIYWSTLTETGKNTVLESIKDLSQPIDKIYVSPFPRTIETAHYVYNMFSKTDIILEKRLREIYHGKYSGMKNNEELDNTRLKQIDGDYFVRFGEYGENKFDIEFRLCEFLYDVYNSNFKMNTIMIISHGSITSYMKRILKIKSPHIKTGKLEEFINVDFSSLFKHRKELNKIKSNLIKDRTNKIESLDISSNVKKILIKLCKKEFNNMEFSDNYFSKYLDGISSKNLKLVNNSKFDDSIILVCFYNNFENFISKWMSHYINIGIKNFVLVDNSSSDKSTEFLKQYSNKVNISFWNIDEKYDCYKMCGWKQQIFEYYGVGHKFLTVDSDELFIYDNYKNITFDQFLRNNNIYYIKSLMLDVYSNKNVFEGKLDEFNYIDKGTYKVSTSVPYIERFYGGPRSRIFGINPSLQKIPFILYTGKEMFVNDHYYYPWKINSKATFCSYLLHYKFLPEDKEKYNLFVKDGRHWNNSHEYKIYSDVLLNNNISFYNENISISIDEIAFKF